MANTPAPQGNSHGMTRIRAVGSPFEVSNNASRVPQTLNYVDCYPMKEEQFGSDPIYAVTCREAFKSLGTYDLSTISTSTTPNNGISPPATLSGYFVAQIGQLLVVDDASTNVGGTVLFCNVMLYNAAQAGTTNAYAVVSLQLTVSGNSGTTVTSQPLYIFFDTGPTIGAASIGNFTTSAGTFIDPYYLIYSAPAALSLTISANTANYNIYNAAVAAGMTTARSITVTINNGVTVGTFLTGSGFYAGTTITVINKGTILGNGGTGGAGSNIVSLSAGAGSAGTPAIILNYSITLTNTSGLIAGGGGGGGGGQVGGNGGGTWTGGGGGGAGAGYTGTGGALGLGYVNSTPTSAYNGVAGSSTSNSISGGHGGNGGTVNGRTGPGAVGGSTYLAVGGNAVPATGSYSEGGAGGGGGGGLAAAGGTGGTSTYPTGQGSAAAGGAAGNAIQCNGYSVLNIPNGTYTGAGTYGTIYGVIG